MCINTHILIIDFKLILHPLPKWSKLYGVEILNEGFGSSVDDSVLEMQATFVARSVAPLQAVGRTSLLKS